MSLATRCSSCGTVFRVVQDQLKVSEGWVRCGRCNAVFNALEGLFDLDRDPAPEWSDSVQAAPHPPVDFRVDDVDTPSEPHADDPALVDRIDEQIFGTRRSAFGALSGLGGLGGSERKGPDFADARFDTDVPDDDPSDPQLIGPIGMDSGSTVPDSNAPGFIREAERQQRWQGSGVRRLLMLATVLLALLLFGQGLYQFRDQAAARWPALEQPLGFGCELIGCTVEAPRRIEDIAVESTALTRGNTADSVRLAVVLHNRAATITAMPWIELSLTDPNGELVARRALGPQDFRVAATSIAPGAEATLQALLSTGGTRVTGYTVEAFYP